MIEIVYDLVAASELEDAINLEVQGFPPDEAASLGSFKYRQSHAGDLFLGAYTPTEQNNRRLVAYVCSTLSASPTITHSSMSTHDPSGKTVCIHAVCVDPAFQRQGIASALLREYVSKLEQAGTAKYEQVALIVHAELRPLYEKVGFEWLGPSDIIHGPRSWFEMRKIFDRSADLETTTATMPSGVWEALQRPSRNRPTARLLSSFENVADLQQADGTNKFGLLCSRPNCGSVILNPGVATFIMRPSFQIEPANLPINPLLPALPAGESIPWWLVSPSPMMFENIGFSRPVQGLTSPSGKNLKLLACAECDLGPLGWSEEGGTEFLLAPARVGYRA